MHKCAKYERKKKRQRIYFKPYNIKYCLKSFKITTFNNQSNKKKKRKQGKRQKDLNFLSRTSVHFLSNPNKSK